MTVEVTGGLVPVFCSCPQIPICLGIPPTLCTLRFSPFLTFTGACVRGNCNSQASPLVSSPHVVDECAHVGMTVVSVTNLVRLPLSWLSTRFKVQVSGPTLRR